MNYLPCMPFCKSFLSSLTAHFLNSSCALTAAPELVLVLTAVGFLTAGTALAALTALGATGVAAGAGVLTLPLAPTVVHALPPTLPGLGAEEATLLARSA